MIKTTLPKQLMDIDDHCKGSIRVFFLFLQKIMFLTYMMRFKIILLLMNVVISLGSYVLLLDRNSLDECPWIQRAMDEGCGSTQWTFEPLRDMLELFLDNRQISAIGSPSASIGTGYAVNHLILIS